MAAENAEKTRGNRKFKNTYFEEHLRMAAENAEKTRGNRSKKN